MLKSMSGKPKARNPEIGTFETKADGDRVAVTLRGRWDVPTVMANEPALYSLVEDPALEAARHSVVDISGVTRLDTVGAIAVSVLRDQLAKYGTAEISGAQTAQDRKSVV